MSYDQNAQYVPPPPPAPPLTPGGVATPIGVGPSADGMAIGALVLGILSFCLGCLTGIPAIILGIIAVKRINADPQNRGGKGMAIAGIVIGSIMLLVTIIFGIVGGISAIYAEQMATDTFGNMDQNIGVTTTGGDDYQTLFDQATAADLNYLTGSFTAPSSVNQGDSFLVVLNLANSKGSALSLDSVDVHDEYLAGITITASNPASTMEPFHIPVDNSMSYSMKTTIPASGSREVSFTCNAAQRGTWAGNFDVCITYSDCLQVYVSTTVD